jgi:pyruvate,water dikinase
VGYGSPLNALRRGDEPRFGGKSANLGELLAAGIPVPPGFAIAAGAEDSVWEEIPGHYAQLGEQAPVAVRSSAVGEDTAEATFAGQYESYLWVRGVDGVRDAVRKCWESASSTRAAAYRERLGAGTAAMGVTVQLMVDATVSGVMFTCNPTSGDRSMVAINASWGLGLAVVGGEVTPDDYLVSKVTGEVLREQINDKQVEYVADAEGSGAVRREVGAPRSTAPSLDRDAIARLIELGRRVERHFGSPQDIEWAIDHEGSLFVLQSRPVTGLPPRETEPAPTDALSLVMKQFGARPS